MEASSPGMETWRVVDSGRCAAAFNMAADEALAVSVRRGYSPPVLRLYGWDRPSVTIGCFQKVSDVDTDYCRRSGIPVVRRPTGGRGILHKDELTYSLCAKTGGNFFSRGLLDSYRRISDAVRQALQGLGLQVEARVSREKGDILAGSPLCFQSSSYGEILIAGRKAVGAAQKRWPDCLLQQGSLPYLHDAELLQKVFGICGSRLFRSMTAIRDVMPELDEERLKGALIAAFQDRFEVTLAPSGLSPEESDLVQALLERKYLRDSWNLSPQPRQGSRAPAA